MPCQLDYSPLTPPAFLRLLKCQKEEWHLPEDCSRSTHERSSSQTSREGIALIGYKSYTDAKKSLWLNGYLWSTARIAFKWTPEMLVWCYCNWRHQSVLCLMHKHDYSLTPSVTGQNAKCCTPVMRKYECKLAFWVYRFHCVPICSSGISSHWNILSQHQEPRLFLLLVKPQLLQVARIRNTQSQNAWEDTW